MIPQVVNDEEHTKECLHRLTYEGYPVCTCPSEEEEEAIVWPDKYLDSNGDIGYYKSDHRKVRNLRLKQGFSDDVYIVVQRISRHYGGPEEGGWWYDWFANEEIIKLNAKQVPGYPFWRLVLNTVRLLREDYPQPRYNRHSVLGDEGDVRISLHHHEKAIPEETKERPHYE